MGISLLVKPVSGACNLNCEYCFYKEFFLKRKNGAVLDAGRLIDFVKDLQSDFHADIDIAFQGGEPLLAGKGFYKEVFGKLNAPAISLSVQTNATLIDEEWCKMFSGSDVLVGVSIDGNQSDNALRHYGNGQSSFADVARGIALLNEYNAKHNLVCVVSKRNINNLKAVFNYFANDLQERYLQFIPCLKTATADYSLSTAEYLTYLQTLFDCYFNSVVSGKYVSVRYFDELINVINGIPSCQCGMNGHCERQLVIESDGSVYPCDFYCDDLHLLGNIASDSCKRLLFNPTIDSFTRKDTPEKCKACKYYKLCQGGCRRQRQDRNYCEAIYRFIDENINKLLYISNYFKKVNTWQKN